MNKSKDLKLSSLNSSTNLSINDNDSVGKPKHNKTMIDFSKLIINENPKNGYVEVANEK